MVEYSVVWLVSQLLDLLYPTVNTWKQIELHLREWTWINI